MTNEEAIERLKQNKAAAEFYAGMVQNTNAIENELKDIEAIDMAIESLQDDWIPVSERLPEKDELVLVTVWNDVIIAWRNLYGGWESAEDMYGKGDITAWKPLPAPYKESDSE